MSDEVDKRLMEAADALVGAFDALREARLALDDPRLSSAQEASRNQGFSQLTSRLETSLRRAEEALRKSFVAAAVDRERATFNRYRLADSRLASARTELRGAAREADAPGRTTRLSLCAALIEQGLDATKELIFNRSGDDDALAGTAGQIGEAMFSPLTPLRGGAGRSFAEP